MTKPPDNQITRLLHDAASGGDRGSAASAELLPLVYAELRALAASFFAGQPASHTLQPTALVHEAYLKLAASPDQNWNGRQHFFAVAAKAMRQILVSHARARNAQKRGGQGQRFTLTAEASPSGLGVVDILALDEAIQNLEQIDPMQAKVVELRYFAGLSCEEAANVLQVSERTIKREWRMARAELARMLGLPGGEK